MTEILEKVLRGCNRRSNVSWSDCKFISTHASLSKRSCQLCARTALSSFVGARRGPDGQCYHGEVRPFSFYIYDKQLVTLKAAISKANFHAARGGHRSRKAGPVKRNWIVAEPESLDGKWCRLSGGTGFSVGAIGSGTDDYRSLTTRPWSDPRAEGFRLSIKPRTQQGRHEHPEIFIWWVGTEALIVSW